jgi:lipopolysaccharide transport system permease protein
MDGVKLQMVVLWLPVIQLIQFAFTVSLAYLLAALNVSFRDTQHTLGVILQLLFYLTPVFYDIPNVPGGWQSLYLLNPMVHIVTAYRAIFLEGIPPSGLALGMITLATFLLLPIGYFFFQHQSDRFVEDI